MKIIHPKRWLRAVIGFPVSVKNVFKYYLIPDKLYLLWEYKSEHGEKLNLCNPQSIDEKMQWIKLYDRKPIYHTMIDKIRAKEFVANMVGCEYVIPLLGQWKKFEDINFEELPNSFVLKCNHDSGSCVVVSEKEKMNKVWAYYKLNGALKRDYYHYEHKQWGYKDIPAMILAEEYLEGEKLEYQVFCQNEVPMLFLVRSDLGDNADNGFAICYSVDWQKKDYRIKEYPNIHLPKPKNYDKMLQIAKVLSKNTLHLRVDFYEMADGRLFVGELTFYSHGGNFCNFNEQGKRLFSETLHLPMNVER